MSECTRGHGRALFIGDGLERSTGFDRTLHHVEGALGAGLRDGENETNIGVSNDETGTQTTTKIRMHANETRKRPLSWQMRVPV